MILSHKINDVNVYLGRQRKGRSLIITKNTFHCILQSTCSAVSVSFIPLDEVTARAARGRKHELVNLTLILCS